MSSHRFHIYGLYLDVEASTFALQKLSGGQKNKVYSGDLPDYIGNAFYYTGATGYFQPFDEYEDSFPVDASFNIIRLKRRPSFFSQTYKNKKAMLKEIKTVIGGCLPENFDYAAFLGCAVGEETN